MKGRFLILMLSMQIVPIACVRSRMSSPEESKGKFWGMGLSWLAPTCSHSPAPIHSQYACDVLRSRR